MCCCMCMQTHGTTVDRKQIAPNKPSALKNGSQIRFGNHPSTFILRCESAGRCPAPMHACLYRCQGVCGHTDLDCCRVVLRRCCCRAHMPAFPPSLVLGSTTAEKRRNPQSDHHGAMSVRASHLLVKHRDSRRPSSWKVSAWLRLVTLSVWCIRYTDGRRDVHLHQLLGWQGGTHFPWFWTPRPVFSAVPRAEAEIFTWALIRDLQERPCLCKSGCRLGLVVDAHAHAVKAERRDAQAHVLGQG